MEDGRSCYLLSSILHLLSSSSGCSPLVLALCLLAEISLNEIVDLAVEHVLDLRGFHAGANVLGERVRLHHVVANLVAPGDFALFIVELLDFGAAFLLFDAVELGFEQRHGHLIVLVLTALAAALGGDAGGEMRIADAALRLILVLPAGTAA